MLLKSSAFLFELQLVLEDLHHQIILLLPKFVRSCNLRMSHRHLQRTLKASLRGALHSTRSALIAPVCQIAVSAWLIGAEVGWPARTELFPDGASRRLLDAAGQQ